MHFGQMIKSYRISRGMRNRAKFARELGVSAETMRLLEGGKSLPRVDTLRAIIDLLDLDLPESTKVMTTWLDEQVKTTAATLPEYVPKTFSDLFAHHFMAHTLAAVEEELGETDEAMELAGSMAETGKAIIEDLLTMSDPGDTEEE